MNLRPACTALIGILVFIVPPAGGELPSLQDAVPADAAAMVYAMDVAGLVARLRATPFAGLWADPQVQRFLAPYIEDLEVDSWDEELEEDTGYTFDELAAMFSGDAVWYMGRIDNLEDHLDGDLKSVPVVLLAELSDDGARLEKLLLELDSENDDDVRQYPPVTREFSGVEMHIEQVEGDDGPEETFTWAVFDQLFAVTVTPTHMERVITDVRRGGVGEPLSTSPTFQSAAGHVRSSDVIFFVNLEMLMPLVREVMVEEMASSAQSSPIPVEPGSLYDALGLDVLRAAFAGLTVGRSLIEADMGLTYTGNSGLVKMIAYGPGEAPRPTLIPPDSPAFGTARVDFRESWQAIEDIVGGINPALVAMANAHLAARIEAAGLELDLRRDLLENLGGDLLMIQMAPSRIGPADGRQPPIDQNQVLGFSIKQRQSFELALESLKTLVGQGSELFESREYLETTIYTLKMQQDTGNIAYAITDDFWLLSFGSTEALEAILVSANTRGKTAWDQPRVRRALAELPDGAAGITYHDMAAMGNAILELMRLAASLDPDTESQPGGFGEIPDPDTIGRYLGPAVTGAYKDDSSLVMRTRLLAADGWSE